MRNKNVSLARYTDGSTRIVGGRLGGIKVHGCSRPQGKHLVWMDEIAELRTRPIVGFIRVQHTQLVERDPDTVRRALITNGSGGHPLTRPYVWLGVIRGPAQRESAADPGLPLWARGYQIVEELDPCGDFAAVGYCRPGEEHAFKWAKDMYVELFDIPTGGCDEA